MLRVFPNEYNHSHEEHMCHISRRGIFPWCADCEDNTQSDVSKLVEIEGLDSAELVTDAYKLRGKLVHSEGPVSEEQIEEMMSPIRKIAWTLLTSRVQGFLDKSNSPDS